MSRQLDFNNRTVLVTGGSRGIGREITRQLVERGARVLVTGRSQRNLDAVADKFPEKTKTFAADLGTAEGAVSVADWVKAQFPDTSVIINNAAVMRHDDLTEGMEGQEEFVADEIAVNLTSPMQICTALLPLLSKATSGAAIANISSGLAIAPKKDAAVYCATKAGLSSFTRSLRDQCRSRGLQVQLSDVLMTLVDTTLSRPTSIKKYPPHMAAADVLRGMERGSDEIWVEKAKLLRVAYRISPSLAYRLMRNR